MIEDLRAGPGGSEFEADVCVVGSGAAGLTLAAEFLHSQTSVLVVESGGFELDPEQDLLNRGDVVGLPYRGLMDGRARVLGGATRLWWGQCVPLEATAFDDRDWVPNSGWPLGPTDLGSYYGRAERALGIEGEGYDTGIWARFGLVGPLLNEDELTPRFTIMSPRPDLWRNYRRSFEASRNIRVLLHATVVELRTTTEPDSIDRVVMACSAEKQAEVRARAVVLCCGGLENPRLLLTSARERAPAGLGNEHGLVGRYLQDHPRACLAEIESDSPIRLQNLYQLLYRRRVRYLPKLALSRSRQRRDGLLSATAKLNFDYGDPTGLEPLRRLYRSRRARRLPKGAGRDVGIGAGGPFQAARAVPWAGTPLDIRAFVRRHPTRAAAIVRRRYFHGLSPGIAPRAIQLEVEVEQAPNWNSRVRLTHQRDELGQQRIAVDWRLSDLEKRTARSLVLTVRAEFARLGLGRVRPAEWLEAGGDADWARHFRDIYHHMGTTRMATDPSQGVVDTNCQVYGVRGLYVAGSSVFPASGTANPTLTIVALALRLADHLKTLLAAHKPMRAAGQPNL